MLCQVILNAISHSSFHLYAILLKLDQINKSQKEVFKALNAAHIGVNLHYIPLYRQPYYQKLGFKPGYCPVAERYYTETMSIPMYPTLTNEELLYVTSELRNCIC